MTRCTPMRPTIDDYIAREREVPTWQLLAENGPQMTECQSLGTRPGATATTVRGAVRLARREITNWASYGLLENSGGEHGSLRGM